MLKYWLGYKKGRRKELKKKVVRHHPPAGAARRETKHLTNAAGSTAFRPSQRHIPLVPHSLRTFPAKFVSS